MARAGWWGAWLALAGCSPLAVDVDGNGMVVEAGSDWSVACPPAGLELTPVRVVCDSRGSEALVRGEALVQLSADRDTSVADTWPVGTHRYQGNGGLEPVVMLYATGEDWTLDLRPPGWTSYAVEILSWEERRVHLVVEGTAGQLGDLWIEADVELPPWEELD